MKKTLFICCCVLFFAGCATTPVRQEGDAPSPFYNIPDPIQCVPYARDVSGIPIRGNAHTWWNQAAGRYERSNMPKPRAVMVLSKTKRLRYGHLAVVKEVIDPRHIDVTHSNWGGNRVTRCVIYRSMRVKDISIQNNWSKVRFWNYNSNSYGRIYEVSGFIYVPEDVLSNFDVTDEYKGGK